LRPLGGLLGLPGGVWGRIGPVLGYLGALLGASWARPGALFGRLGGLLGHLGLFLGCVGVLFGASWAVLGLSWAVFDSVKAQEANMLNIYVFLREWDTFCLFRRCWEASSGRLGASWRLLEPSCGHLGRLVAIFRRLAALLDRLGGVLVLYWPVMGLSLREGAVPE